MLDQRLLTLIGCLSDIGQRSRGAKKLAQALGADDIIIFSTDPILKILLPAPGFPQTLPEGQHWRLFLDECILVGINNGVLKSPYTKENISVFGVRAADGSILAVLGGSPDRSMTIEVSTLVPLLVAAFFNEQIAIISKGEVEAEMISAARTKTLADALDVTRRELEVALAESHRSTENMRASQEWFRTTLNSIGDAVIAVNVDRTISFLNPVAEELTGWPLSEAHDRPMSEIFNIIHEQTRQPAVNPVDRALLENKVVGLANHTVLISRDGKEFVIEDSAAPIRNESGEITGVVLVFRDVTKEHVQRMKLVEAHNQLELERARLHESVKARDEFLSIASHELKTPLTTLKLQTQMRARSLSKNNSAAFSKERLRIFFENDTKQIERLTRLIDDMLDISRISTGKLTIRLEQFDLCKLTLDIIERFSPQFKEVGSEVTFNHCEPVIGSWDCFRIEQVITNLLTNAIRYGAGKPVTISVTQSNSVAKIFIQDLGTGIAKESQERIFQRFERADSSNEGSGLGLGLYIVKEILEIHGGNIRVESELGKGSTFIVELPIK